MSTDTRRGDHPRDPVAADHARSWWAGATTLAVLTFLTHGANFGFTIAGSRLLSPADFGTLTALLGIVLVGMAPGMAVQALTAAGVLGSEVTIDARVARRLGLAIAATVVTVMLVLGRALGIDNPVIVVAIGIGAGLLPLTAGNEGLLQGRGRFAALGSVLATGAICKFLVGLAGMGTTGMVWAGAVGVMAGYSAQLTLSHRLTGGLGQVDHQPRRRLSTTVITAVVMMGLLLVLIHVDAVMARILLADQAAGNYAVGATGMRIVFWAPQFAVLLLFPRLVTDHRRRVVATAIGAMVVVGALGSVVAALLGPRLVTVVFGAEYAAMGPVLWRFAWLGTSAVGLQVLALSDLATGRRDALWLLAGAVSTIIATVVVVRPPTPTDFVTTVALIVTGSVVVGLGRRMMHVTPAAPALDTLAEQR